MPKKCKIQNRGQLLRWLGLAAASALLAVSASAAAESPKTLRLAAALWEPYVDSGLPESGVAVDVARKVLARAGYRTRLSVEDRRRTFEGARVGIYDAIAAAWPTQANRAGFLFSDEYLVSTIVVIKRRASPYHFANISDLEGLVVGTQAGHTYGSRFESTDGLIRVPSNHLIQNLQRLVDGYLDVVVGDQWSIRYEISRYMRSAAPKLHILPIPLDTRTVHLAVPRTDPRAPDIINDFNAALAAMRADGSRQAILDRHVQYLRPIADLEL
jgi:polar amino acid transport system substrate-binding protein